MSYVFIIFFLVEFFDLFFVDLYNSWIVFDDWFFVVDKCGFCCDIVWVEVDGRVVFFVMVVNFEFVGWFYFMVKLRFEFFLDLVSKIVVYVG